MSPESLVKLELEFSLPARPLELVNVFILGQPHKLTQVPNDEEICDLWEYYEHWRSDPLINERMLKAFVENQVWLQSSIFNLAQHYKQTGNFEQALVYLDRLVLFEGESDDELFARSQILFKQNRYSECGRSLRRQIRLYTEFDGPKFLRLRLAYVTCRSSNILRDNLGQLLKLPPKFPGNKKDKYEFLALAHLISPKEFETSRQLEPFVMELIALRRKFSADRTKARHDFLSKDFNIKAQGQFTSKN